jgi:glycosyltransferase involved in cell wall biosynthesis
MVSSILAIVFIGATIVQLLFWLLVFSRLGNYPSTPAWLKTVRSVFAGFTDASEPPTPKGEYIGAQSEIRSFCRDSNSFDYPRMYSPLGVGGSEASARFCAQCEIPTWVLGIKTRNKPLIHSEKSLPPISVVICGCNEADNLSKYLDRFLAQDYPLFEVVVVNDNSVDETEKILFAIQKKYSILHPVTITEQHPPGKKYALQVGIAAAKYDLLLLSDADCYPSSPHWIRHMQSLIKDEVLIGLGYSPYEYRDGLLNRFIRFEAIYTAIQYFSFSIVGMPYMGVGRNLIYHKSLYQQQQGFSTHLDLASGDDDLFVNAAATGKNTAVQLASESFVFTIPKMTWGGYYHQKTRHLTTGNRYKPLHQVVLGMLSASHFFHYTGGLAWGFYTSQWSIILIFYLARATVVAMVSRPIFSRLKALSLWPWMLFLDLIYLFYYIVFAPVLIIGNPRTSWKH